MHLAQVLLRVSRPHFWLYEAGTFFLGVCIAASTVDQVLTLQSLLWGIYFLIPANLLIYGTNDVFDYETDMQNPKKISYESVLAKELHRPVLWVVLLTTAPFVFLLYEASLAQMGALGLFWFFALGYSVPPVRAKARPFLDSFFSAGHYVATGMFGYYLVLPQANVPWLGITAAMAWAMAMHAYSAVPDIEADMRAGLRTTATVLGDSRTIWYCLLLYAVAAGVGFYLFGVIAALLFMPYLYLLLRSLEKSAKDLLTLYQVFPYVNAVVGMTLCFIAFYQSGWL